MDEIKKLLARMEQLETRVKILERENVETTNILYELMNEKETSINIGNNLYQYSLGEK